MCLHPNHNVRNVEKLQVKLNIQLVNVVVLENLNTQVGERKGGKITTVDHEKVG